MTRQQRRVRELEGAACRAYGAIGGILIQYGAAFTDEQRDTCLDVLDQLGSATGLRLRGVGKLVRAMIGDGAIQPDDIDG